MRSRLLMLGVLGLAGLLLLPVSASAQSTIAGLVTDTTGSILPGVTVEAASPALIEKVRTAVTDGQGRYSIVDLRPGIYTVTFTLTGFSTVMRDGVEVASNTNVPINAELRRRFAGGDHHGLRPVAGRRRADHGAAASADARRTRRDSDVAELSADRVAHAGRQDERARRRQRELDEHDHAVRPRRAWRRRPPTRSMAWTCAA